jgi:hypothetical protein
MSSDDYCEISIMIVFWCWLPDHRMMFATRWWTSGVNFVAISCYEMSSYYVDLV